MKKSMIMITALLGFGVVASAQNAPTKVEAAFNTKFPTAKAVQWEKENETEWEAEFTLNGVEYAANFSNEGIWKETEHVVEISELPSAVKTALFKNYANYEIKHAEMIETPTFKGYEVKIQNGEEKIEVVINEVGKIIKSKVKKD